MAELQECKKAVWCVTQSEIVPVSFTWIIANFNSHVKEVGYHLQSCSFSSEVDDSITWRLKAYPNGKTKDSENYLSIFLHAEYDDDDTDNVVKIKFCCSVLDVNNQKTPHGSKICARQQLEAFKEGRGWSKFTTTAILQQNSDELLPDDTLTLYCEINIELEAGSTEGRAQILKIPDFRLENDLADLFHKESFSDVTLVARDEKFRVHRNILAARSTVFAAMFASDMKEKNQDEITIADLEDDVLRDLLYFIYSGETPVDASFKRMTGLLSAADKYDLKRLKIIGEQDLCQQVTIHNASDLLILAYLHNAKELKEMAMEFIYNNATVVMKSENWSTIFNHPRLLNDVLEFHVKSDLKKTRLATLWQRRCEERNSISD